MQAVVQERYGESDVLQLREIPEPVPGPRDVVFRVTAAGLDAGVWHLMTGLPRLVRLMGYGLRRPRQPVRGREAAGLVTAVGPEVTRFRPGDEVFGWCEGAFAEYARAREDQLLPRPGGLTAARAAALPISAVTALQAVRGRAPAGTRTLVLGAAGGVGGYAVQLARAEGASVTGVCSTATTDLVRSLGADEVLDYTAEDITTRPERYDLIVDTGGNRPLARLRRVLAPRGTLVVVGAETDGRWLGGTDRALRTALLSPFTTQRLIALMASEPPADLARIAELAASGTITPAVDGEYSLADVPDLIRRFRAGGVRGKAVVRP
ncbi:NAD(P)-dependent alcohol dehydrogenase [Streptomyces sp. NPDC006798]|uniref:NAD(P)-dependent alcohol dehydrogenase n=1 Tax=Streptomyces sp. NPDC006798 TaxID=3155462 RepID=UPI003404CB6C